jgi:Kef-type K+ transport system membrane component KefB
MDFFDAVVNAFEGAEGYYFLFELALIVFAVKLFGHWSVKLGQPSVFGKLLAGIILGPTLLNLIHPSSLISELAEVGVILLMFMAGLETDMQEFRKSALAATSVAVAGVIVPFFGGLLVSSLFGYSITTAVYVGALLVATSVSISVQTLKELGRLKSREGVTILGAAVLDDVLGVITLSAVLGFTAGGADGGSGFGEILTVLVKIVVVFAIAVLFGYYVLPKVIAWFKKLEVTQTLLAIGIISALLFAYLAELFGVAGIVGAYVCGLMLSLTPYREELAHKVESFSYPFFVPMFFFNIGLIANFREMSTGIIWFSLVLAVVAVLTKIVGCGLGAKLAKFSTRSSIGIGAGMIARGEVGLIIAMIGIDRGLIDNDLFGAAIIVVLVSTLVTPPLLKLAMPKRTEEPVGDGI